MRRRHFESLRPVCPVCRTATEHFPLTISSVFREEPGHIVEGVLGCTKPDCRREYPIIDGVPLLIPAIRAHIGNHIFAITARDDLSEVTESILGDCTGPGSAYDVLRQHLSCYCWDHYADLDPHETVTEPRPGAIVRLLEKGLSALDQRPGAPVLDVGCSVGRTTFELGRKADGLVLGIDLNFSMLRLASSVLRQRRVRYPRRRIGVVYDRREFAVPFGDMPNVDFWACDAAALPFAGALFPTITCLNVLDCVPSPPELLRCLARVIAPDGRAILGCPYDWSTAATPVEAWLGGHSQRGDDKGAAEPILRTLLTPGAAPWSLEGLRLTKEIDGVPWQVRMHDRGTMTYQVHLVVAAATGKP